MKKLTAFFCAVFASVSLAHASNIADDFRDHYNPATSNLSAYNRDLSSSIGTVDFHTGRDATFPAFNIGASVSVMKPSSANNISTDSYTYMPFIVAETRIPVVGLGVVLRGTDFSGYRSLGGGLTYQMDLIEVLHLSFGAFYDNSRTDWYKHDHYSASAIASTSVLMFTPYVGVGYDLGRIETRGYTPNRSSTDSTPRAMVGVNIHPFPLFSGFIAYTVSKDTHGFTGGLGLSF